MLNGLKRVVYKYKSSVVQVIKHTEKTATFQKDIYFNVIFHNKMLKSYSIPLLKVYNK